MVSENLDEWAKEIEPHFFNLEIAERNHHEEVQRRLQTIENLLASAVLQRVDSFRVVVMREENPDGIGPVDKPLLEILHGKYYFYALGRRFFTLPETGTFFLDMACLIPFNKDKVLREKALRDPEFRQAIYSATPTPA